MKKKQNKGFTLIELAIVLVIIGLIIGAVLKGQDLIENAKAKKFISKVRSWEVSQWTYLDRQGRFTGDTNNNGKIEDGDVATDFVAAGFTNPPYEVVSGTEINTITMGSLSFYVFYGTNNGDDAGLNILTICGDAACGTFTAGELLYIQSLDVAIDGSADGTAGQIIGVNAAPGTITAANWYARYAGEPTAAAWIAGTTSAAVYYFDAQP